MLNPLSSWAQTLGKLYSHPYSPYAYMPFAPRVAAGFELMHRLGKDYDKPKWGLDSTDIDGVTVPVLEQIEIDKPFCRLIHFARQFPKSAARRRADPTVLVFAPLSGHHATLLRDAGYQTAYFGKWHMGPQKGQRPGFTYSASFIGQGQYMDCPMEINGTLTPTKGWVDDVSTDMAIDWVKKNAQKPFSLVLGFKSPHNKRGGENLPARLRHLYEGKKTQQTPNCAIPAVYGKPFDNPEKRQGRGLVDNDVHLDYLRHIKGIDENLGRLLDTLDELKLTEDTVVVYTSDNGFFLGERGLGDKRALYEEGIRIPFIARYPKLFPKGKVVDQLVINQDLAPTWLDLAGLPAHPGMQGRSFKPLALGEAPKDWRTSFLCYYRKELGDTPTCRGIRTENAKLVIYPKHPEWTEVFDLKADPYELKNLPADGPLAKELAAELEKQMKAVGFTQ